MRHSVALLQVRTWTKNDVIGVLLDLTAGEVCPVHPLTAGTFPPLRAYSFHPISATSNHTASPYLL
jgi:hypothetical protein